MPYIIIYFITYYACIKPQGFSKILSIEKARKIPRLLYSCKKDRGKGKALKRKKEKHPDCKKERDNADMWAHHSREDDSAPWASQTDDQPFIQPMITKSWVTCHQTQRENLQADVVILVWQWWSKCFPNWRL